MSTKTQSINPFRGEHTKSVYDMVPDRALDPYFAEFLPGMHGGKAHQHPGCEFLYLLKGTMAIQHGAESYQMEQGDAVYFDSNVPHSYGSVGASSASALIVTMASGPLQHLPIRNVKPRAEGITGGVLSLGEKLLQATS